MGNGRTNAWDSQNRLVSCIIGGNTTAYKYGADGLRRQSTKNGVSTDYANDGTMLVREGHATGGSLTPATVTATYLIGARGPEYRRDDTQSEVDSQGRTVTKARWYVFDGLGSVVGEVDPLGNLTSSPKYDVYGATRSNGGTASSKQGFVGRLGHLSEPETGLVYMQARYYDANIGRFISQDPSKNGNNWFMYCSNNPVNRVDANGKADDDLVKAFIELYVGIFGSKVFGGAFLSAACFFLLPELALVSGATGNLENMDGTVGLLLMGVRAGIVIARNGIKEAWGKGGVIGIGVEVGAFYLGECALITIMGAEMDAVDSRMQ